MREQVKEVRMQPYSMELRSRVVMAYEHREGSMRRLAKTFRVSLSGVRDLITRYRETGQTASRFPLRPCGMKPTVSGTPLEASLILPS